jgi:hypothetical protein
MLSQHNFVLKSGEPPVSLSNQFKDGFGLLLLSPHYLVKSVLCSE